MRNFQHIAIGGKEYPFFLGTLAVNHYCKKAGYSLGSLIAKFQEMAPKDGEEVQVNFTIEELLDLLYFGLKDGHRKAGKDFRLQPEHVADMCDDEPGLLIRVLPIFSESIVTLFGTEQEAGNVEAQAKTTAPKLKKAAN